MTAEVIDAETGLPVLAKQPSEERVFRMDFANKMTTKLASVVSVSAVKQGRKTGSSSIAITDAALLGTAISMVISGGTDGEAYKVTGKVLDEGGNTLEADGLLLVRDY